MLYELGLVFPHLLAVCLSVAWYLWWAQFQLWRFVSLFSRVSGCVPCAFGLLWHPGCSEEHCLAYRFPLILVGCREDPFMNLKPSALSWSISIVLEQRAQLLLAERRVLCTHLLGPLVLCFPICCFPIDFLSRWCIILPLFRLLSPPLLLPRYLFLPSMLLTCILSIPAIQHWTDRYLQLLGLLTNWPFHCYIITSVVCFLWCRHSYLRSFPFTQSIFLPVLYLQPMCVLQSSHEPLRVA